MNIYIYILHVCCNEKQIGAPFAWAPRAESASSEHISDFEQASAYSEDETTPLNAASTRTYEYIYISIYIYTFLYVYIYAYTYTHIFTHVYKCTYVDFMPGLPLEDDCLQREQLRAPGGPARAADRAPLRRLRPQGLPLLRGSTGGPLKGSFEVHIGLLSIVLRPILLAWALRAQGAFYLLNNCIY